MVENAAKRLVWTKDVLSVFKKQKTEIFENALVWTGPKLITYLTAVLKGLAYTVHGGPA